MLQKLAIVGCILLSWPAALVSQSATVAASLPAKLAVEPLSTDNKLGTTVPLQVDLKDAEGRKVGASEEFTAEIEVQQPSGQVSGYTLTFAPGESSKQIAVPIDEAGVAKVSVKQQEEHVIGGTNFVLVRPDRPRGTTKKSASKVVKPSTGTVKGPGAELRPTTRSRAHLVLAAFSPPQPQLPAGGATAANPQLVLTVSGEDANGGTRADGVQCAKVQVFYLGTDDLQRDIEVWLSPSNGNLDNNPVVIRKGTTVGSACWTSQYPIPAATLTVATTKPLAYAFAPISGQADPRQATHKFTDPIMGIEFANPPQDITVVDAFNLIARFKGSSGPLRLTEKRDVHFSATSAFLTIKPAQTSVNAGDFDSSTVLIPTYFGKSTVTVSTPGYQTASFVITVKWISVLLASLLGGLLGGILAWISAKGKPVTSIVTGMIVGPVASWAYVVVGLPKVETPFLHNQLSVIFVALMVGFAGIKGLTSIASKFGIPTP